MIAAAGTDGETLATAGKDTTRFDSAIRGMSRSKRLFIRVPLLPPP